MSAPWPQGLQRVCRHDIRRFHLDLWTQKIRVARRLYTQTTEHRSLGHDIYISSSTNPYFNLAFEHWLFRNSSPSSPLLLLYRNSPCVVIGRNQNPWTEVNFGALRAAGIPFIRRWSGGGTVYHDSGNTNFSIHLPRSSFNRRLTGEIILRAVCSLGVDAHLNERNDIFVGPNKISSAYKLVNNRAYHHGTMLIASRLDMLGKILRPPPQSITTKGISSVRSSVTNLQEFKPEISHETFTDAVVDEFRQAYNLLSEVYAVDDSLAHEIEEIHNGMSELTTWHCRYGQTPQFTRSLSRTFQWGRAEAEVKSKHGIITDCHLQVQNDCFSPEIAEMTRRCFSTLYQNQRYGFPNGADKDNLHLAQIDLIRHHFAEIAGWLEQELQQH